MRYLFCGSRNWNDEGKIRDIIILLETIYGAENLVIIHGAAKGADSIAGSLAREYNIEVEEYPADWLRYGRAAGPIRNKQMLDEGKPNYVYAFHENIWDSKGTRSMIGLAKKYNIPYTVIN
jgi:hypothetical protein